MKVGIDASRAFSLERTGIEEYSYQVIKHLADKLADHQIVLYLRKNQKIDFELPQNWRIRIISFPRLWTQVGLSLEMLLHPVDVLFVPAHIVPVIHPARNALLYNLSLKLHCFFEKSGISNNSSGHCKAGGPKNTIVTIHGLEYELYPAGYSFWERVYMRWSIKLSCRWAKKIIAVSKNTKQDLVRLYNVPESKVEVVYEGVSSNSKIVNGNSDKNSKNSNYQLSLADNRPYLLFIGRLEKRKNIEGIVEAYKILKEKYGISHKLILAGKPGYEYPNYKLLITDYENDIIEAGYISEKEKLDLLANANVFLFPSFYEGFGLPVLEAQSRGVPVVVSNVSSLPEVAGEAAAYCDPNEPKTIADATYALIGDKAYRDGIIEKGYENVKRFSWDKCAKEITDVVLS